MKWLRRDVQLFSMSFLDLLACALGGVLVLFIATVSSTRTELREVGGGITRLKDRLGLLTDEKDKLMGENKDLLAENNSLAGKNDKLLGDRDRLLGENKTLTAENEALKGTMAEAIGLKGRMENVIFVFDSSDSMDDTDRFDQYTKLLQTWVRNLAFERFNVLDFDSTVKPWSAGRLRDATPKNRKDAVDFIANISADGQTNTLAAVKAAFAFEEVDTIILFSDGIPNPREGGNTREGITGWIRQENQDRTVVVNTIAIGESFDAGTNTVKEYAIFLWEVAAETQGRFSTLD